MTLCNSLGPPLTTTYLWSPSRHGQIMRQWGPGHRHIKGPNLSCRTKTTRLTEMHSLSLFVCLSRLVLSHLFAVTLHCSVVDVGLFVVVVHLLLVSLFLFEVNFMSLCSRFVSPCSSSMSLYSQYVFLGDILQVELRWTPTSLGSWARAR